MCQERFITSLPEGLSGRRSFGIPRTGEISWKLFLAHAEENLKRKYHLKANGFDFDKVVDRVGQLLDLKQTEVLPSGKYQKLIAARSMVWFFGAVRELGINQIQLALKFGISQPAASMAVSRGKELAKEYIFHIIYGQETYRLMYVSHVTHSLKNGAGVQVL